MRSFCMKTLILEKHRTQRSMFTQKLATVNLSLNPVVQASSFTSTLARSVLLGCFLLYVQTTETHSGSCLRP